LLAVEVVDDLIHLALELVVRALLAEVHMLGQEMVVTLMQVE
jgi:hypothetical protein